MQIVALTFRNHKKALVVRDVSLFVQREVNICVSSWLSRHADIRNRHSEWNSFLLSIIAPGRSHPHPRSHSSSENTH